MVSGVTLEAREELVGGAMIKIERKEIFGLFGDFKRYKAEILEICGGFFMIKTVFYDYSVAVAFNELVIGVDMKNVGFLRFKIRFEILGEKSEEFFIFVVDKGAARGVSDFVTEERGLCDEHGGGEKLALAIFDAKIMGGPAVLLS